MTFLAFRLMEASGLLRLHFKGFNSHKDVKSDIGLGLEWLSEGINIAQDNLALVYSVLTPL